jgi:formaldehyde-activating enzyme involved in methanogenesis
MTRVVQKYDHDTVHVAVAHLDKPEDEEVMCSKEMFLACDRKIQLYSVVEEAMVLALERSLVPYPGKKTPKEAFTLTLMKVCTSITSGWREFALENYDAALDLY